MQNRLLPMATMVGMNVEQFIPKIHRPVELEDVDFHKEAELIRAKKSKLSARNRAFILSVVGE